MRSLHFHLPFGMYHRARAPSIRFRLPPTLWTDYLLVPPISMLQQQLPQHLSHQLPSLKRQLACYLIKARLRMLLPPLPHLLKHRLRTSHKFRLRLFSFHLAPPFALLSSYSKSTSFQPRKKSGMHPRSRNCDGNCAFSAINNTFGIAGSAPAEVAADGGNRITKTVFGMCPWLSRTHFLSGKFLPGGRFLCLAYTLESAYNVAELHGDAAPPKTVWPAYPGTRARST